MNRIKQMIRTSVAALCAVCLLNACSSTLDEALDEANTAQTLNNIEIGDFPVFGLGPQTRSADIGTYDAGKSAWENGDEILLKITNSKSVVTTATLIYNGTSWIPNASLSVFEGDAAIEAYYAPAYEWKNNELALKTDKVIGTEEYLTYSASVEQLTDGFTISFGSRDYSRLRVATDPGMNITLTAADFTPAGNTITLGTNTLTATADTQGNAYFYGTWTGNSSATISTDAVKTYGTVVDKTKTFTLPTATNTKSYAVAGPEWVIDQSCYYKWDATSSCEGYSDYSTIQEGLASNSCKDAPTREKMIQYINAGTVYWDDGAVTTNGYQTFKINGTKYHQGIWLLKEYYWPKTISNTLTTVRTTTINIDNAHIRTDGDYFFLPAVGQYFYEFLSVGIPYYWSSSPEAGTNCAYALSYNSDSRLVFVSELYRSNGCLPMVME